MTDQSYQGAAAADAVACPHWQSLLAEQARHGYFTELMSKVGQARAQGAVFPPADQVFNAFAYTPWDRVKVVVLGQDPYHQPGQAQGLAFSVPPGVRVPPSLRNIFKALAHDYEGFTAPEHGDLRGWAEQGVLLLNTVLTVEQGKAHAHARIGWETFTAGVMEDLNQHPQPLVFMLWGKHAQAKGELITNPHHLKLSSVHPSPLSAHRGFLTCGHFLAANQFLATQDRTTIAWQAAGASSVEIQQRQQKLAF